MAELMVRCVRCHEVFDAEVGSCTKCGTPYHPPVTQPRAPEGAFVERYAGTDFVPPDSEPAAPVAPRRNHAGLLLGGGAALMISALVVASLWSFGALGGAAPTQPVYVISVTPHPSPTPTLPPTVSRTIEQLNDLKLSAHIAIKSHVQQNTLGTSQSIVVKFDGQVSNGDEWGIIESAGVTQAMRFINGRVDYKLLPSGRWSLAAQMPAYEVICPVFGIESTQDLQLVGREVLDGHLVNHLQSTDWWRPDISRLALVDLSGLLIKPDSLLLDLYANADGTPIAATFSGTNSATNGTKLLDIRVTYTFTDVGVQVSPPSDIPEPSVPPSASPTK
jgi:hypothetical protein